MKYRVTVEGAVPVVFCQRQKRWIPVEEHVECEHCVAPVYDEFGDPVSFICTCSEERMEVQPEWEDRGEIGRGPPNPPLEGEEAP